MKKRSFLLGSLLAFTLGVSAQSYSLRTNVLGLATTNLNLEASMTLGRKWSLHLPVQYNPFRFSKNRQFRNLYVAPGVRYWLLESYMGPFIGMHGTAGTYSVGNLFGSRYRYEGEGYGVGVSIGKAYQLSTHWNVEWEVVPVRYGWAMTSTCVSAVATLYPKIMAGISFPPVQR